MQYQRLPNFVPGMRPDRRWRRTEDSERERAAERARTSMTSGRTTALAAATAAWMCVSFAITP